MVWALLEAAFLLAFRPVSGILKTVGERERWGAFRAPTTVSSGDINSARIQRKEA